MLVLFQFNATLGLIEPNIDEAKVAIEEAKAFHEADEEFSKGSDPW